MENNWQTFKFHELCAEPTRNGLYKSKEFHGEGSKIINMGELFAFPRLFDVPMRRLKTTESEIKRFGVNEGDLLFARRSLTAAGAGKCCLVCEMNEPTVFESSLIRARIDSEKASSALLYYWFESPKGRHAIDSIGRHVAVAGITGSDLANVVISLPPLPEQRAIASILGSLDEQIEGLRRQNATLEQVAQVVFRAWFVDFEPVKAKQAGIAPACLDAQTAALFPADFEDETKKLPRGWKNGCLQNFIDFALGGDWGKDEATATETEAGICVRGADIPALQNGGVGKMPLRYLKSSSLVKRSLQDGDLIIEISGGSPTQSTGRPVLVTKGLLSQLEHPLITSNFCRMVRLKEKNRARFVYLWLRDLYSQNILMQYETGTTGIKNFGFARFIEHAPLIMAPDSVMQAFDDLVAPLYEKIGANGAQARTLAQIRDALLPRLLSGSLRVPESLVCAFDFGDSVHSDAEFELQLG